jgi:hypothetical protein
MRTRVAIALSAIAVLQYACLDVLGLEPPVARGQSADSGTSEAAGGPCVDGAVDVRDCGGGFQFRSCFAGKYGEFHACAPEGVRPMPPPPGQFGPRSEFGAVWTGTEIVFWGGRDGVTYLNNGAAYNPVSATWRMLPAAPLAPRIRFAALWTGKHVLVAGGQTASGLTADGKLALAADYATYDPAADRWSAATDTGLGGRSQMAFVYAPELGKSILIGGFSPSRIPRSTGVRIDAETRQVAALDDPSGSGFATRGFWAARKFHAFHAETCVTANCEYGTIWEPGSDRWRKVSGFPGALRTGTLQGVAVTVHPRGDGRVVFSGGQDRKNATAMNSSAYLYNAGDESWTNLPSADALPAASRAYASGFFVSGRYATWGGIGVLSAAAPAEVADGILLAADGLSWSMLPDLGLRPRRDHAAIAIGADVYVWGGSEGAKAFGDGAILRVR